MALTVHLNGHDYSLVELSHKYGINYNTIFDRYNKGWRDKDLIRPLQRRSYSEIEFKGQLLSFKQLSMKFDLNVPLLKRRYKNGDRDDTLVRPVYKNL